MDKIEIRPMKEEDLEKVTELEKNYFSKPWSKNSFLESMKRDDTLFLVAKIQGKVVGYLGSYQSFEEIEIVNIAVDEAMRQQGIGKKILEELFCQGKSKGAMAYTLEVRVSNLQAITLYEKMGFKSEGIRKKFYEDPLEDANIMWKRETFLG